MLRFTGSLFFILFSIVVGYSQNTYIPTAYRVGIDVTGVGYTFLSPNYTHIEVNNDLQFGKRFFTLDIGTVSRSYSRDEFAYQNRGGFFRIGIDHNFIPEDPDGNLIFIGARYGRAFFSDDMQVQIGDPAMFGYQDYQLTNQNLRARWLEANAGMKIRVWNQIFLGYTLRLRFARKVSGETDFYAYEIPGYGRAARSSNVGFSYHIFYRIPL